MDSAVLDPVDDEVTQEALAFEGWFATAPDLAHLSAAARRVLATASALFARQSAPATSVRELTSACGLSPGALYRHFASKDDLLYAVIDHGHTRMENRLRAALAAAPETPEDRVAAFVHAYVLAHLERPALAMLVRREFRALSPPRLADVVARRRRLRDQLVALLQEGEESGRLRLCAGADSATRTAVMMMDMCSRTSEWFDPARDPESALELAEVYVAAAMRLAGSRPA